MGSKNLKIRKEWMEILYKRGNCLSNAHSFIKNDRELDIKAIQKSSLSLAHASLELRDDNIIAHALIKSWPSNYHSSHRSFEYLSSRIKSDKQFSQEAFKIDPRVFLYLDKKFIHDPDFYLKVFKRDDWDFLIGLYDIDLSHHSFLNLKILSKIDLSSLNLVQRLTILRIMLEHHQHVFFQAALFKELSIDTWEASHQEELIFWQHFPGNHERVKKACIKEGKNCLHCYPPI